jgi:hypothetical protein
MTAEAEQLFEQIRTISSPPSEDVFEKIASSQHQIMPLLLDEIAHFAEDPNVINKQNDDYIRHVVSLFIVAYFREEEAYPLIIKLISHPGDNVIQLTGEVFTEALGRILASVCDGNLSPIKSVIENPNISPWLRSAALDSLMVLWKENILDREDIVHYLRELMEGKLEASPSYVWDAIALIAYDLHPGDLEDLLLKAINNKLIAPMVLNKQSLATCVKDNVADTIKNKENVVDGYIKEPFKELTWWLYPDQKELDKGIDYAAMNVPLADKKIIPGERGAPMGWRSETIVRTGKKTGRNDPCYCGSGRKYKRCCGSH